MNWLLLVVGALLGAFLTYLLMRHQATKDDLSALWDAIDRAEAGFHPVHTAKSDHVLHTWGAGLAEAWREMEKVGVLAKRLPDRKKYGELRELLIPLADQRPTQDQRAKLEILQDPGNPSIHAGIWRDVLPDERAYERLIKGHVLIRRYVSEGL